MPTWIARLAIRAPIVARHSPDELLQIPFIARLLTLVHNRGHDGLGRRDGGGAEWSVTRVALFGLMTNIKPHRSSIYSHDKTVCDAMSSRGNRKTACIDGIYCSR